MTTHATTTADCHENRPFFVTQTTAYLATVRRWQDVPRRRPTRAETRAIIEHRRGHEDQTERYAIAHEPMDHEMRGSDP